jgi:hypothetical protein
MHKKFEDFSELSILLDRALLAEADYSFVVDRDEDDAYTFTLDEAKPSPRSLSKSQVMKIVPTGSYWSYFLGFRDIFGIPVPGKRPGWVAFGFETALKHETRGAYLYLKALLLPFPLTNKALEGVDALAENIFTPISDHKIPFLNRKELQFRKKTEPTFPSQSIASYKPIESWIIRKANQGYRDRKPAVFRTMAMKKNQLYDQGEPSIIATTQNIKQDAAFGA